MHVAEFQYLHVDNYPYNSRELQVATCTLRLALSEPWFQMDNSDTFVTT